jgi:hypothetical protein
MTPPRKSGTSVPRNAAPTLDISAPSLGYSYPQRCPPLCPQEMAALGAPLSIRDVAKMIGCSVWTVRQTLIPMGLPVFRSGPSGRLIFYTTQVVRWIQSRQGGTS